MTPPKVDIATKIGIKKANGPYIRCAKVWRLKKCGACLYFRHIKYGPFLYFGYKMTFLVIQREKNRCSLVFRTKTFF